PGACKERRCVLANRLEHPVPHPAVAVFGDHEGGVDEGLEPVDGGSLISIEADVCGRVQAESSDEDRDASEQRAPLRIEQADAPAERLAQRLLAGRQVSWA